jgi:ferric-dicitrate binding protein FerR (iron transport regulator)
MKDLVEISYAILSETASPDEKLQFQEMVREGENLLLFNQYKRIWEEAEKIGYFKKYDEVRSFYELDKWIENNKRTRKRYLLTAVTGIAAGIMLMLGLFEFMQPSDLDRHQKAVVFNTEAGNRSAIILPDSSRVWLNSKTHFSYDADYGQTNRNVYLVGEAFFEVRHSDEPFIVSLSDFKIKVCGTKFNVSAYPDDQSTLTCLESGKISIKKEGEKERYVTEGQLVDYERKTSTFKTRAVNPQEYSAWRSNKMYLHDEPLQSLCKKLERKFNIGVSFIPENLGDEVHYTGVFSDEDINEILDAISIASGLKYSKEGNHYTIKYRNVSIKRGQ